MKKTTILNIIVAVCLLAVGILAGRMSVAMSEETTPVTIPEITAAPAVEADAPEAESAAETIPEETEAAETEPVTEPVAQPTEKPSYQPTLPPATAATAPTEPAPSETAPPVQDEDELPIVPA